MLPIDIREMLSMNELPLFPKAVKRDDPTVFASVWTDRAGDLLTD